MQVSVLVGVSDRSGDHDGSAGGGLSTASASTTAAGRLVLVVDPCVVGDGWVVERRLGQEGRRDMPGPVCLSAQEVVDRGGPGDLGSAVG